MPTHENFLTLINVAKKDLKASKFLSTDDDVYIGALFLDDEDFIENVNIPVLIVHGESDMAVRYESGVEAFERLKNRGYDVELYSFDGAHVMNREIVGKAIEWMKDR